MIPYFNNELSFIIVKLNEIKGYDRYDTRISVYDHSQELRRYNLFCSILYSSVLFHKPRYKHNLKLFSSTDEGNKLGRTEGIVWDDK